MAMVLKQIRYFLEILATGSFSKAAIRLGLTQPALSRQISLLEQELGTKLLIRNARNLSLSPDGEKFLEYAHRFEKLYNEFENEFHTKDPVELSGDYKISTGGTMAAYHLPHILKKIYKEFPTLSLRVLEGDALETRDALLQGDVDLAILTQVLPEKNLIHIPFYTDTIVPVVAKSHPLASRKKLKIEDIKDEAYILFHPSSSIRRDIEKKFRNMVPRLNPFVLMELRSLESVLRSIEAGLGIGFISSSSLGSKLKILPVESLHIKREYYIIHKQHHRAGLMLLISRLQKYINSAL